MARSARRFAWPGLESGHTFRDSDLAGKPGAGYLRVSSNPDETEQRSVGDQEAEYWPWVERTGIVSRKPDDVFADDDRSASMFATRQRENFERLLQAIEAGRYQVVWFWSTSRHTRGDRNIYELAKVSADHGVLWCVAGQLLNPANEDDLLFLGIHHLMDRQYSWRISKDSRRGHKSIAQAGKPHGPANYGYKREYERTADGQLVLVKGRPKFLRDVPDAFGGNGRPIENSPAYVVREIFDRLDRGESATRIAGSLEDRRIPRPRKPRNPEIDPCRWTGTLVRFIAQNPAYIGKRIYHQESWRPADRRAAILDGIQAQWPPLVGEEQFWRVQQVFSGVPDGKWRPSGAVTLLGGIARCGECHAPLQLHKDVGRRKNPGRRPIVDYYVCSHRSHVGIRTDWLDDYVQDRIVSWAADKQVYAHLRGERDEASAVAAAARADVSRLELKLEEARAKGEDPDEDAVFWSRRAQSLTAKLAEAGELAYPPSLSPIVAGVVGPDAADKWWKLRQENLFAAKEFIRIVADIRVHKGVRGGDRYHARIDPGRISWAWLTGPGDHGRVFGEPISRPMHRIADALRADPWEADHAIAVRLQCRPGNAQRVRRELEDAGEIPVIRRKGRGAPVNHGYQPRPAT